MGWVIGLVVIAAIIFVIRRSLKSMKPRWGAALVSNGQMRYMLTGNRAGEIAAFFMSYFKEYEKPQLPWKIFMVCNLKNQGNVFELKRHHFTADGEYMSERFYEMVQALDPDWMKAKKIEVTFHEITNNKISKKIGFQDSLTEKRIRGEISMNEWIERTMQDMDNPQEETFYRIVDRIFMG